MTTTLRHRSVVAVLGVLLLVAGLLTSCRSQNAPAPTATTQPAPAASVEVYFSPRGGCTEAIVRELERATTSVRMQAYSFTSARIAKALADAHKRGVQVEAVLDKSNQTAKYSGATFLKNQGIDVQIDAKHAIAHNKIMIIDDRTVITGSFNFTKAAEENNAENLLIIRNDPDMAARYLSNFRAHQAHSVPYTGLQKAESSRRTSEREQPERND